MLTPSEQTRMTLQRVTVMLLFLLTSAIFVKMTWGLLLDVFMAAIFAGLTYPLYSRILHLFRGRRALSAVSTLLIVLLVVVTPLVLIANLVATQALLISQAAKPTVSEFINRVQEPGATVNRVQEPEASINKFRFWDRLEPHRALIAKRMGQATGTVSTYLVNGLSAAAQGTLRFFFHLFIMLYSMYFFLIHGHGVRDQVMRLIPLDPADKELLLDQFVSVSRATLKGTLVIGAIQGSLAGLAFFVAGIKAAAFWGTVMAILSVIPGIGAALVWLPTVAYLLLVGQTVPAIALFIWCAVVVGTADNILRPLLVGKDTKMPDLLVLLSTFGGLSLFGFVGLVIGPVFAALFLVMLRIFGTTFGELFSAPEEAADEG